MFRTLILLPFLAMSPDFGGGFAPSRSGGDLASMLRNALGDSPDSDAIVSALRGSNALGGAGALSVGNRDSMIDGAQLAALVDASVAKRLGRLRGIGVIMPVRSDTQAIDNASEVLSLTGTFRRGQKIKLTVTFSGTSTLTNNQISFPESVTATMDGGSLWAAQELGFNPTSRGGFVRWATLDRDGTTLQVTLASSFVANDDGVLVVEVYDEDAVIDYTAPGQSPA